MSLLYRGFIVVFVAFLLVVVVAVTAHAQSWSSAVTSGLTSVETVFESGTYTWTLRNLTSLPGDSDPTYDVLVWELIPYQVREPISWVAPTGWTWAGDRWAIAASPSRKYYTPDALGPGQSVEFVYTPNPDGALINASGPQPDGLAFIAHVGAVIPGSGSPDGSAPWTPTRTSHGRTWADMTFVSVGDAKAVPEPGGIASLALCLSGMVGLFGVRNRRSDASRSA